MNPNYLQFLYNLGLFNIKLGLSTISSMLERLENPHHHPAIIHFAGTNGKGSTLVTLENLLIASGFKTGSTISPHLISFNERFRINGIPVEDEELDEAFLMICQACDISWEDNSSQTKEDELAPTFFEFAIAMAFVLFRKHQVDYILLETGLGGRLDATNVISNPLACVITKIDYDHQEFLGETLDQITLEKLGIVKENSPVFSAYQSESVLKQIREFCSENHNEFYFAPQHYGFENLTSKSSVNYYVAGEANKVSIQVKNQSLQGDMQKENTSTALGVYHTLLTDNQILSPSEIQKVLSNIHWSGRLQYIKYKPPILIDGAHNLSGFKQLLQHLNSNHLNERILFAIGWKKNKNLLSQSAVSDLKKFEVQPIQMEEETGESVEEIKRLLESNEIDPLDSMTVPNLIDKMKRQQLEQYDLVVISGSLYLIGEFLEKWSSQNQS